MYRQRFFQEVVPRLLKLYRESESCNKAACFAAIANQLAFIPEGVLVAHITTLIPLLIQCLSIHQPPQLIISTINAFMGLMSDNVNAIEDYVDNLVPRLLNLAKDGSSMVISTWNYFYISRVAPFSISFLTARPPTSPTVPFWAQEGSIDRLASTSSWGLKSV